MHRSKQHLYSITSSELVCIVGGGANRKTVSRRSLRNPIKCFDQLAIATAFLCVPKT
jgi:hypothetical protein